MIFIEPYNKSPDIFHDAADNWLGGNCCRNGKRA